ncbi:MAG: hypothetical protein JNL13_08705 [Chitinophagaceae bacterium]|nr:hypothetical protein [Chitinophagaceae bacterium]
MGNFLALSGIIGKTKNEVFNSLADYAHSVGGGIHQDNTLHPDNENCCIIDEANGNTTIFYPGSYLEWDDSSSFISRALNATVFSLHIHDGDLWMYLLYNNGKLVDQFNPVPDYWDENIPDEETQRWKGNALTVTNYVSYLKPNDIEKYLVRWNLDEEESTKAYPTDEFTQEEWQLLDFMAKLKLPYPLDDKGNPKGHTYTFWTDTLPAVQSHATKAKPWWKFW